MVAEITLVHCSRMIFHNMRLTSLFGFIFSLTHGAIKVLPWSKAFSFVHFEVHSQSFQTIHNLVAVLTNDSSFASDSTFLSSDLISFLLVHNLLHRMLSFHVKPQAGFIKKHLLAHFTFPFEVFLQLFPLLFHFLFTFIVFYELVSSE